MKRFIIIIVIIIIIITASTLLAMCDSLIFLIICTLRAGLIVAPDFPQTGHYCVRAEIEHEGLLLEGSRGSEIKIHFPL